MFQVNNKNSIFEDLDFPPQSQSPCKTITRPHQTNRKSLNTDLLFFYQRNENRQRGCKNTTLRSTSNCQLHYAIQRKKQMRQSIQQEVLQNNFNIYSNEISKVQEQDVYKNQNKKQSRRHSSQLFQNTAQGLNEIQAKVSYMQYSQQQNVEKRASAEQNCYNKSQFDQNKCNENTNLIISNHKNYKQNEIQNISNEKLQQVNIDQIEYSAKESELEIKYQNLNICNNSIIINHITNSTCIDARNDSRTDFQNKNTKKLLNKSRDNSQFAYKLKSNQNNQDIQNKICLNISKQIIDSNELPSQLKNQQLSNIKAVSRQIQCTVKQTENNLDFLQTLTNSKDYLNYHGITENHRSRMVDWMIQVLRVLKKLNIKTFIQAIQIMDKYLLEKMISGIKLSKNDLHLIGLTSMFIASKYEDVIPILMHQIINDAAHNKYQNHEIIEQEMDILKTIGFIIPNQNFHEQSCKLLQTVASSYNNQFYKQSLKMKDQESNQVIEMINLLTYLVFHSMELSQINIQELSRAIVQLALKYKKNQSSAQLLKGLHQGILIIRDKNVLITNNMFESFYQKYKQNSIKQINYSSQMQMKSLIKKITTMYKEFDVIYPNLKNLKRNYPDHFNEEGSQLLQSK